jgi:hypothetical protein
MLLTSWAALDLLLLVKIFKDFCCGSCVADVKMLLEQLRTS